MENAQGVQQPVGYEFPARLVAGRMPQAIGVIEIPLARLRAYRDQPRKDFRGIAQLAASIAAVGQQVPVMVRLLRDDPAHDFELIDGERRVRACQRLGRTTVLAFVRDDILDDAQQYVTSLVSNFGRATHGLLEIADAVVKLRRHPGLADLEKGEQARRIGLLFGRGPIWVSQHGLIAELCPEARRALFPKAPRRRNDGKLAAEKKEQGARSLVPFSSLQHMACLSLAEQRAIVTQIREGIRPRRLVALIRRRRLATQAGGHGRPVQDEPSRVANRMIQGAWAVGDLVGKLTAIPIGTMRRALVAQDARDRARLVEGLGRSLDEFRELCQALRRMVAEIDRT